MFPAVKHKNTAKYTVSICHHKPMVKASKVAIKLGLINGINHSHGTQSRFNLYLSWSERNVITSTKQSSFLIVAHS